MGNGYYELHTSDGFETSVANENILDGLISMGTTPSVKEFSLVTKSDCTIKINGGKPKTIIAQLGLDYSDKYDPVGSIQIIEDGVEYYIALGV